jgi:hypothetical protein
MLTSAEKAQLKDRDALEPKARANLDYRIAQKIRNRLSELDELNQAICSIPEKKARRALNDEMVVAIFELTENILRILGYVPVKDGPGSTSYVIRSEPEVLSKDDTFKEFKVRIEAATAVDEARQLLMKEHIKNLQRIMDPNFGMPVLGTPRKPTFSDHGKAASAGYTIYNSWMNKDKPE